MRSDIRPAAEADLPELIGLWRSCFADSEEYIRIFYRENFSRVCALIYTVDGRPVSMIHLMDAIFADGKDGYPVRFVYAVGTLPALRGSGYMRSLILSAEKAAKNDGYGLFLKPSPGMEDYYSSLGFEEDNRFRVFRFAPEKNGRKDISFSPLSAEGYNRLRDSAFSNRPYVKWDDSHVRWCVDENAFCGGKTLSLDFDGDTHFLMGCPVKDVLRVTETDLDPKQLRSVSFALCGLFGVSRLEAFLPEEALNEGPTVVSSMIFNAPVKRAYANLLLF